ncbi:uncharacterized protein LOC135385550 [Ornithodoros turicata]|uniref:uncharacterized protein LOC135385550 n=1 Tax=Ornithodoros turicata TaxID=34597 RepID=UPI003138BE06
MISIDESGETVENALKGFAERLASKGRHFGFILQEGANVPLTETTFGPAPLGSPVVYQQSDKPARREVWRSQNIRAATAGSAVPTEVTLFADTVTPYRVPALLDKHQADILKDIILTKEEATCLERNTRQQANSHAWHSARRWRLTASKFGQVLHRSEWTEKGLTNLTAQRDLCRVRAVAYGRENEDIAAQSYADLMRRVGHDIVLSPAGIIVDPGCPWLGASPDRFVYDPTELTPHGVLEIKCPYSLRDSEPSLAKDKIPYLCFNEHGHPKLKRDHKYYFQILGQMGLTGCEWGDFVVCSERRVAVERIYFDLGRWKDV